KQISSVKKEPEWMLEYRLNALNVFNKLPMPKWGADLSAINFDEIIYYMKSSEANQNKWEDVPEYIKETFDKLGIPEAERKFLGGVGAQFDSEVVYHSIREDLEKQGVVFLGMDQGLAEYESIVREHFGTVIPSRDNKFAALNSAVWSGGSFVYVPPNIKVEIPLQAYFRINAQNMGQFERTLIIADKGSQVHYIEGCFTEGTEIRTENGMKPIEEVQKNDNVLTHEGEFKEVYFTQVRPYSGDLYKISVYGDTSTLIEATQEHPFYAIKRSLPNERNKEWKAEWTEAKNLKNSDYVAIPINQKVASSKYHEFEILQGNSQGQFVKTKQKIRADKNFFSLAGYFLAEGSTSNGFYTSISFGTHETEFIQETKELFSKVFGIEKFYEPVHKKNNGVSIVVSNAKVTRVFEHFGKGSGNKEIPEWMMLETPQKQAELIKSLYFGDGNYFCKKYAWGTKELFRINTTSKKLAKQVREILLRLHIACSINLQKRKTPRKTMYVVVIGGQYLKNFGRIVGVDIQTKMNNKKRATMFHIDDDYMYAPIKKIEKSSVHNLSVYNFGVRDDESYTANGVAVHNCTAPTYSSNSLHSAVVEVIAK
ncbi:MAG: LAGLIDADG family homing endonuclease, partial [archaeon]